MRRIRDISYLSNHLDVNLLLCFFGEQPYLIDSCFTFPRNSFNFQYSRKLSHFCIHFLIFLPRSADNVKCFFPFQMFFPWIDGIISNKELIKLLKRARQDNLDNFLLLSINNLRIKKINLNISLVKQFVLVYFFNTIHLILTLRCQNIRWQCLFLPKSIDNSISVIIFKSWKSKFLLLFFLIFCIDSFDH